MGHYLDGHSFPKQLSKTDECILYCGNGNPRLDLVGNYLAVGCTVDVKNLLELMSKRRDVRHFIASQEVPHSVEQLILRAAETAPSVGLSQPLRLVFTRSMQQKQRVLDSFSDVFKQSEEDAKRANRKESYLQLKLEGIKSAPLGIAVFCENPQEFTIGVKSMANAVEWSAACAIQNIWLALEAEELGMGWVSIVRPSDMQEIFKTPKHWTPMGYLCVGKAATDYGGKPMLVGQNWKVKEPVPSWQEHYQPSSTES